jgi:hypothetical protein
MAFSNSVCIIDGTPGKIYSSNVLNNASNCKKKLVSHLPYIYLCGDVRLLRPCVISLHISL